MPREVVRLTLDLDPDLHEKIKQEAESDGVSVSEAIRERLKMRRPPKDAFRPPDVLDVSGYAASAGIKLDVQKFMDFYDSNGWKVGKVAMKDWKAAARRAAREWAPAPTYSTKTETLTIADGEAAAARQQEALEEIAAIEKARAERKARL